MFIVKQEFMFPLECGWCSCPTFVSFYSVKVVCYHCFKKNDDNRRLYYGNGSNSDDLASS
jgi:hypothetical protein